MKLIARFDFKNVDGLEPQADLLVQSQTDLMIQITRIFRQTAFPNQPQQALNGAVIGLETILKVMYKGNPAYAYRWQLRRNKKFIQNGKTDIHGLSGELNVDLSYGHPMTYNISIFEPKKCHKKL